MNTEPMTPAEAVASGELVDDVRAAYERQLKLGAVYHALGDVEMVGRSVLEAARLHMLMIKGRRSPTAEAHRPDSETRTPETK